MEEMIGILKSEALYTVLYLAYGFICAVSDFKRHHINLRLSIGAAIAATVLAIIRGVGLKSLVLSVTVGASMLILSRISGYIGSGDAVYMIVCGLFMGCGHALIVCIMAWFICGAVGLVMIIKGCGRKAALPFVSATFVSEIIIRMLGQRVFL